MRVLCAALLWVASLCVSWAEPVPRLHAVTDVAADDVLNIRAEPRASADKIGTLAHDARDVEIVKLTADGAWGLVNLMEFSGWVSMRYLDPQMPEFYDDYAGPLLCYGTEPFWSFAAVPGGDAEFRSPAPETLTSTASALQHAQGHRGRYLISLSDGGKAIIRHTECSDGMSDNLFALEIDLILSDNRFLTGCCSIMPR